MRALGLLVLVTLQIAMLPLAIVGIVLITYRQLFVSRRLGVSQTGIEVLNGRWTMHVFGMREDEATMRLAATLPNTSPVGIWLVLFPLWVQYKLTGEYVLYPRVPGDGNEDMRDIVVARTIYIDRILERVLPEAEQFVLLGAGYDTRAYGELASAGLRCFELDQPSTQRLKIDGLRRAGIDTSHVTFVPVDFSHEDAFDKLRAAGYDPGKRSIFLWEGVTLYLGEEDVRRTLREMRDRSGTGSVLVADFYGQRMIEHGSKSINKKSLELTNEAFSFGLELSGDYEAALAGFLESAEVRPLETVFLGRNHERGPLMVVAEVEV